MWFHPFYVVNHVSHPFSSLEHYRTSIQERIREHLTAISSLPHTQQRDGQAEIQKHRDALRELYEASNALLPIVRAPAETLSQIFLDYIQEYPDPLKSERMFQDDDHPCHYQWIKISHVCRRWRQVALGYRKLWTYIPLGVADEWIEILLYRSQQAALSVSTRLDHGYPVPKVLAEHMHRIRNLDVAISGALLDMSDLGPANALRRLNARAIPGSGAALDDNVPPLFGMVYNYGAPLLQELKLQSITFAWRTDFFHPALTTLTLEHWRTHYILSLVDVLDVLEKLPLLQDVRFKHCLPLDIRLSDQVEKRSLIKLPHLRFISLHSESITCVNLFSYLEIPPDVSEIHICADHLDNDDNDLYLLHRFTGSPALQYLHFMTINNTLGFLGEVSTFDPLGPDSGPNTLIRVSLPKESSLAFSTICNILPLSEVRELMMHYLQGAISDWAFTNVFDQLHNVETLKLCKSIHIGAVVLAAFSLDDQSTDSYQSPSVRFPRLQVLEIDDRYVSDYINSLHDCLRRRKRKGGSPIQQLTVHAARFRDRKAIEECVKPLREYVNKVQTIYVNRTRSKR